MGIRSNVNSNSIFGLTTSLELLDADGGYSALVGPNGDFIRPLSEQRYGLKVEFDNVKQNFTISSGTTGDASTIKVTIPSMRTVDGVTTFYNDFSNLDAIPTNALEGYAKTLLGIANTVEVATKEEAIRGVESSPASITGSPVQINVNNNFTVDATNYKFVVAVDDVKGTVELPFGNTYTLTVSKPSSRSASTSWPTKRAARCLASRSGLTGRKTPSRSPPAPRPPTHSSRFLAAARGACQTWMPGVAPLPPGSSQRSSQKLSMACLLQNTLTSSATRPAVRMASRTCPSGHPSTLTKVS